MTWEGRNVEAWLPDPLGGLDFDLPARVVRRTEQAAAAVHRMGDRATGTFEAAARLLLRAEGVASSAIEGLRANAADVALAEVAGEAGSDTAAWVADNLAVVDDALARPGPLTAKLLHRWHRRLMQRADLDPRHVGAWRDRLGWVGGRNPLVAAHVGAPPEAIPVLMRDLFAFVARHDVDAVTQAAVAHAQFEVIHPFADGNGRIGRILVGRILAHRLGSPVPPPVSVQFAHDVGGYLSGLTLYRQGHVDAWVSWFADAIDAAASRSGEVLDAVAELRDRWRHSVGGLRADAAARRIVEVLPAQPVLNARTAADLVETSAQAARLALLQLVERGVLTEMAGPPSGPGRPSRWFVAHDLLRLLGP